jgi:hypothetical protein
MTNTPVAYKNKKNQIAIIFSRRKLDKFITYRIKSKLDNINPQQFRFSFIFQNLINFFKSPFSSKLFHNSGNIRKKKICFKISIQIVYNSLYKNFIQVFFVVIDVEIAFWYQFAITTSRPV